uniref:Uncharacterized protein n=1 Tax=Oryza glumipatula TaxID=40148 RepID=A0A0D9Z9W0_9ORYZ
MPRPPPPHVPVTRWRPSALSRSSYESTGPPRLMRLPRRVRPRVRRHARRRRPRARRARALGVMELRGWGGEVEMASLLFGRKVYYMGKAKSRRDHGVVPLLESVRVRLSSTKLIAPYVSVAGLPVLIDRGECI